MMQVVDKGVTIAHIDTVSIYLSTYLRIYVSTYLLVIIVCEAYLYILMLFVS